MELAWTKAIGLLLMPPAVIVLVGLLGFLLHIKWRFFGLILMAAAFAALWVLSLPLTGWQLLAALERGVKPLEAADNIQKAADIQAIVVLGGGRYTAAPEYGSADTVSAESLVRLRYAARLHRRTGLPILVSGGPVFGERTAEAVLMQQVLERDFQIKAKWVEDRSRNTLENATYSKKLLEAEGIRRIYLVTHAWHMPRAEWAFVHAGLLVTPAPTAFTTLDKAERGPLGYLPSARGLYRSQLALHEHLALRWYKLTSVTRALPPRAAARPSPRPPPAADPSFMPPARDGKGREYARPVSSRASWRRQKTAVGGRERQRSSSPLRLAGWRACVCVRAREAPGPSALAAGRGEGQGERRDLGAATGFVAVDHDLVDTLLVDLVDAHHGVQREVGPAYPGELGLEPLLRGVEHDLAALAEQDLLDLDERIERTLADLARVDLVEVTLLMELDTVDGLGLALTHGMAHVRMGLDEF